MIRCSRKEKGDLGVCGIVGYVGQKESKDCILEGLKRLEYRGYDSCGMATCYQGTLSLYKSTKRVHDLEKMVEKQTMSNMGIGHTRWATHGEPNELNAHPQVDNKEKIAVVHNGIIENYLELRDMLEKKGYVFHSQTDTEVIPNLLSYYNAGDMKMAIMKTMQALKGSYAVLFINLDTPNTIYAMRNKSPLLIGLKENEKVVASDICAFSEDVEQVLFLENEEFAIIKAGEVCIYNVEGDLRKRQAQKIELDFQDSLLGGYSHYMEKEIYEDPLAVRRTLESYVVDKKDIVFDFPKNYFEGMERITIVACGTAMHAGLCGKYAIEELCHIPVTVEVASEFRYKPFLLTKKDFVIFVSQSGETADTIAAQELVKSHQVKHLSMVNVKNSTLDRSSEATIYTKAGKEIAVASTKAYVAQVALFLLFAIYLAEQTNQITKEEQEELIQEFCLLPNDMEKVFENTTAYQAYAQKIKDQKNLFFMGRGIDYYTALEGSLKLKEISYIHSEAYQAGELKHGTIALIENGTYVITSCMDEELLLKTVSNIKEVVSRGAKVLFITNTAIQKMMQDKGKKIVDEIIVLPKVNKIFSPLLSVIPMQWIAYMTTILKGFDVDKPRNLAKSVTVE